MSGTENSMQELFARAASLLLGNEVDAAGDHDATTSPAGAGICRRNPATGIDPETANRAHLLIAASRFTRVFELAAPDAPGLFSFGAQFDPALADPLHDGSPMVGVSGVGLTLQEAFQGCIGEGIEYLSQLQTGTDAVARILAPTTGPENSVRRRWSWSPPCRNAACNRSERFRGIVQRG